MDFIVDDLTSQAREAIYKYCADVSNQRMPVGTSQAPVSRYLAGGSRSVANPFQAWGAGVATGRGPGVYPNPAAPWVEHDNISTMLEEDMIMQMYRNSADGEHFVDKHRTPLINRVANLEPILDELLAKRVLTQEEYDSVRYSGTPQAKMRQLYLYVRGWGITEKDQFYGLLEEKCRPLIRDLERQ
ncbi:hypothetical protein XENTR_v10023314 [Xenopus tropicalis]|nr:hypothetical protein XENTR_v10023314 [Xenopus tropicalis]